MAITKSAKLAISKSERNRVVNDRRRKTMREAVKTVRKSVDQKDLAAAYKALDKAAKTGVIKKGTANRKKSRLAKAVAKTK